MCPPPPKKTNFCLHLTACGSSILKGHGINSFPWLKIKLRFCAAIFIVIFQPRDPFSGHLFQLMLFQLHHLIFGSTLRIDFCSYFFIWDTLECLQNHIQDINHLKIFSLVSEEHALLQCTTRIDNSSRYTAAHQASLRITISFKIIGSPNHHVQPVKPMIPISDFPFW